MQLAELQLSDGDTTPPPADGHEGVRHPGPVNGPTMKPNAGWTGVKALRYSGGHTADGRGYAYDKVFDVDIAVTREQRAVVPDLPRAHQQRPRLPEHVRGRRPRLHRRHLPVATSARSTSRSTTSTRRARARRKSLYANQWNRKVSDIGAVAAGKTIDRILVGYDNPKGTHLFNGWIDDIRIDGQPGDGDARAAVRLGAHHPRDQLDRRLLRGNNIPATAVPHGFNFWTPMTDAGSISWLYAYQQDNNADNLPRLQAFAASHEPSPWMGDRQTFQVMPSPATGVPNAGRDDRALAFRHANEIAKPYYYGVKFENGMRTEIAPTDHAALFRFTFTGDDGNLIFDNVDDDGDSGLTIDEADGTISG